MRLLFSLIYIVLHLKLNQYVFALEANGLFFFNSWQCCGAGAGSRSCEPKPLEPPLLGRLRSRSRFMVGAGSRSRTFKAAPVAFCRQAKEKSLVIVSNMTIRAV